MLVGGSAFASVGLDPGAGIVFTMAAAVVLAALRGFLPPLPVAVRRGLITPFVLAAGGIFWSVVRAVTGDTNPGLDFGQLAGVLPDIAFPLALVTAGAAVYYAMLIYAPRQIAEREGGPVTWILRFALFLASLALGLGWLSLLGG